MNKNEILRQIDEEIARLTRARDLFAGTPASSKRRPGARVAKPKAARGRRMMSAEGRARIAAAQKRRWANQRREKQA